MRPVQPVDNTVPSSLFRVSSSPAGALRLSMVASAALRRMMKYEKVTELDYEALQGEVTNPGTLYYLAKNLRQLPPSQVTHLSHEFVSSDLAILNLKRWRRRMVEFQIDTHPGHSLHLLLFTDVTNSKELVESMKAGTLNPELAFFTATLVPATFPVLAAAHKALLAQSRDSLATRTLHSELIYNYSGSKHISEALRRFGINETSNYILVGRFDATAEELEATRDLVKGTEINLEELPSRAVQSLILKYYKITPAELEVSSVEEAVTCRVAARDIL